MNKLILTILMLTLVSPVLATPQKDLERKSKRDYMTAKNDYLVSPTQGNYNKMIKARMDMAMEVIKQRKERKQK